MPIEKVRAAVEQAEAAGASRDQALHNAAAALGLSYEAVRDAMAVVDAQKAMS